MLPQELGLGRGELAIGQRALPVQRSQRFESGRNPRALDRPLWRRHDHAVGRVAWSWRAEPVWVMAPRMMPTVMQARRVRVAAVAGSRRVRVAAVSMMAREGRVRVPITYQH